jgi:hypothetical protein
VLEGADGPLTGPPAQGSPLPRLLTPPSPPSPPIQAPLCTSRPHPHIADTRVNQRVGCTNTRTIKSREGCQLVPCKQSGTVQREAWFEACLKL